MKKTQRARAPAEFSSLKMFWIIVAAFAADRFRDHPFKVTMGVTLVSVLLFQNAWEIMAPILIASTFMAMFALEHNDDTFPYVAFCAVFAMGAVVSPLVPLFWFCFQLYEDDWKHTYLIFDTVPLNVIFLLSHATIDALASRIFDHQEQRHVYGALAAALVGAAIKFAGKKKEYPENAAAAAAQQLQQENTTQK